MCKQETVCHLKADDVTVRFTALCISLCKCPKFYLTPFNIVSSSRNNCGNIQTLLQQKLFKTLVRIKIIWTACDECWSLVSRSLLLTLSHELGLFHAARCLEAAGGDAGSAQTGRATYCCHGSGSVRRSYKHQHKDTKTRLRQKERKEERERNKELIFFKHFLLPEWETGRLKVNYREQKKKSELWSVRNVLRNLRHEEHQLKSSQAAIGIHLPEEVTISLNPTSLFLTKSCFA